MSTPDPAMSTQNRRTVDASLLRAAVAGDQDAWATIVATYGNLVYHVLRRYPLDAAQREDVLQTTWLRLLEYAHGIRDPRALAGWLATTASREALSLLRQRDRETPTDVLEAFAGPVFVDTDARLQFQWQMARLRLAVAALPPRERVLIEVLLEPDRLSYREISQRLGMPVGAIGPVRGRALAQLREALGAESRVPSPRRPQR